MRQSPYSSGRGFFAIFALTLRLRDLQSVRDEIQNIAAFCAVCGFTDCICLLGPASGEKAVESTHRQRRPYKQQRRHGPRSAGAHR